MKGLNTKYTKVLPSFSVRLCSHIHEMTGLLDEFRVKAEINLKMPGNRRKLLPALVMKFCVKAHSDSYLQSLNKEFTYLKFLSFSCYALCTSSCLYSREPAFLIFNLNDNYKVQNHGEITHSLSTSCVRIRG